MTIIVKTQNQEAAKKVLRKVYDADPQSAYANRYKNIVGSVLNASLGNCEVTITSSYYNEYSLNQMFND